MQTCAIKDIDTFKGMVHQGTELKQKIAINPHPKKSDITHYWDLVNSKWVVEAKYVALEIIYILLWVYSLLEFPKIAM